MSGADRKALATNGVTWEGLNSGYSAMLTSWGTGAKAVVSTANPKSYYGTMNRGGGNDVGGLDGFLQGNGGNSFGVEATCPGAKAAVTQHLYHFAAPGSGFATTAVKLAGTTIQTVVDGRGNGYTKLSVSGTARGSRSAAAAR